MRPYSYCEQPPLVRAIRKVHAHLAEREGVSIDPVLAEEITRVAIGEYLSILAEENMTGQALHASRIGPHSSKKEDTIKTMAASSQAGKNLPGSNEPTFSQWYESMRKMVATRSRRSEENTPLIGWREL